jgi:hypothetical protein
LVKHAKARSDVRRRNPRFEGMLEADSELPRLNS